MNFTGWSTIFVVLFSSTSTTDPDGPNRHHFGQPNFPTGSREGHSNAHPQKHYPSTLISPLDKDEEAQPTAPAEESSSKQSPTPETPGIVHCPAKSVPCPDNSTCLEEDQRCDSVVHCSDASDELNCTCAERVGHRRRCDGYADCPDRSDEHGCLGCSMDHFSCVGQSRTLARGMLHDSKSSKCVRAEQICDNKKDCDSSRDEESCFAISPDATSPKNFLRIQTAGYLQRNVRGVWYPLCYSNDTSYKIPARKLCRTLVGQLTRELQITQVPVGSYDGQVALLEGTIQERCASGYLVLVTCPPPMCGKPAWAWNRRDAKIVGGYESEAGAWPFVVVVYRNGTFHCGASILNKRWIVSAAHCFIRFERYYYEVQSGNLRRLSYSPHEQTRLVTSVVVHETFDSLFLRHDIALARLDQPLQLSRWTSSACPPPPLQVPLPGENCTVMGWGALGESEGDVDHLQQVEVEILEHCRASYNDDETQICAGYAIGGRDACQGDSGGPLLCRVGNQTDSWYLAGIVSHGKGCARAGQPGVYTRVSKYLPWVQSKLKSVILPMRKPLTNCPGSTCRRGAGRCVFPHMQCDGIVDCMNAEDELNCEKKVTKDTEEDTLVDNTWGDSNNLESSSPITSPSCEADQFLCIQNWKCIPIGKKCDLHPDCPDATDERDCRCNDYLQRLRPNSICDGIFHCWDYSDELDCNYCPSKNQIYCPLSKLCINETSICDSVNTCSMGEDENYCMTLVTSNQVTLDREGKPEIESSGLLVSNSHGHWRPFCAFKDDWAPRVSNVVCDRLFFRGSLSEEFLSGPPQNHIEVSRLSAAHTSDFAKRIQEDSYPSFRVASAARECFNVRIECDGRKQCGTKPLYSRIKSAHAPLEGPGSAPFFATLFRGGKVFCGATLVHVRWLMAPKQCFSNIRLTSDYVSALLGSWEMLFFTPYNQIRRVDYIHHVRLSDIILLRLDREIVPSEHVSPICLTQENYDVSAFLGCYVTGFLPKRGIQTVTTLQLDVHRECSGPDLCVSLGKKELRKCGKSTSWSGAIVCTDQEHIWHAAALFYLPKGPCIGLSRRRRIIFPNLRRLERHLEEVLSLTELVSVPPPQSTGFLCPLGEDIPISKMCDGIPDCFDPIDETVCGKKETTRCNQLRSGNCICRDSRSCEVLLGCVRNGEEPCKELTCAERLQQWAPQKLCDGHMDCMDKSDERWQRCGCRTTDFTCHRSPGHCVLRRLVCDGEPDCPRGEDEEVCLALEDQSQHHSRSSSKQKEGYLKARMYGQWQLYCIGQWDPGLSIGVCRHLGFSQAIQTDIRNVSNTHLPITLQPDCQLVYIACQ